MQELAIVYDRCGPSVTLKDQNILARELKKLICSMVRLEENDSRLLRDLYTLSSYNLLPTATLTIKSKNVRQVTVLLKYLGQDCEVITFVEENIRGVLQSFMSRHSPRSSSFHVIYRGMTLNNSDRLPSTQHPIVMCLMNIEAPRLLRVLSHLGEVVQTTSSDDCRIQDLKQRLETEHGFPSADTFCLLHNGKTLSETNTVKDCDIGERTVLQVHLIQHGTINIKCESNTFKVDVKSTDLVKDVKRIIFNIKSHPIEIQRLFYRSKELKDNLALLNYCISFGSTLDLQHRTIRAFVKLQNERRIELEVNELDTVINLKARIESNEQIAIGIQRLLHNYEEIKDSSPLTNYSIEECCTLDLVVDSDWVVIIDRRHEKHIVDC
jgi:hypothetical protein